jgi:hypothetical protein
MPLIEYSALFPISRSSLEMRRAGEPVYEPGSPSIFLVTTSYASDRRQ